jgi:RNA polymerase sigma factor (sigma-70 family)
MQTKILVADNDPGHLKIMKEFLRGKGYVVVVAATVPKAKLALQNEKVDLAILDLRLSNDRDGKDISGLTLAKTVAPHIPKILLTRFPTYMTVREALRSSKGGRAAAIDFVSKPEGLPAIGSVVESAVKNALGTFEHQEFFDNLKSGDREAWKLLWDDEAWRLITLGRRHGFSATAAKDICLEVFRNVAQAERPPRSRTLKTALVNETLRQIKNRGSHMSGSEGTRRRAALKKAEESPVSEELREDIVAAAVKDKISDATLIDQVKRAIEDLPPRKQRAIVMYMFEEDSVTEIAKRLGVTEKTINDYLKTASAYLKNYVSELE